MRHSNRNKKFGREKNQRRALMRTLAHSLFRDGRIETTEAKAKALRPFAERLITHAKSGTLASRRLIAARLGGTAALAKLYKEIAPRCAKRSGGYTRITRLGKQGKRGADEAKIEFI